MPVVSVELEDGTLVLGDEDGMQIWAKNPVKVRQ